MLFYMSCQARLPGTLDGFVEHLGLWEMEARPPSKQKALLVTTYFDYSDSQISFAASFYTDPDDSMDSHRCSSGRGSYSGGYGVGLPADHSALLFPIMHILKVIVTFLT